MFEVSISGKYEPETFYVFADSWEGARKEIEKKLGKTYCARVRDHNRREQIMESYPLTPMPLCF